METASLSLSTGTASSNANVVACSSDCECVEIKTTQIYHVNQSTWSPAVPTVEMNEEAVCL